MADLWGIYKLKCPHTLAKELVILQAAAASKKGFFCKVARLVRYVELRRNHDYFYQVQGRNACHHKVFLVRFRHLDTHGLLS